MNLDCAVGRAQVGLLARYQLSPVLQTGLRDARYLGPSFRFTHRILLKLIFIHQPSSTFFGGKVNPRNVTELAQHLGLAVTVVPNAGHMLDKGYVAALLDRWL